MSYDVRLRVSDISHFVVCPFRSKLQACKKYTKFPKNVYAKKGIEMHVNLEAYHTMTEEILRIKLIDRFGRTQCRSFNGITICGKFDNFKIVKKKVVVEEYKTTSRKRPTFDMIRKGKFQTQLYMFILEPILKELGWEMADYGILRFYSQKDGRVIKEVRVTAQTDVYMKAFIEGILKSWDKGMMPPNKRTCRGCPRNIKEKCSHWNRFKLSLPV